MPNGWKSMNLLFSLSFSLSLAINPRNAFHFLFAFISISTGLLSVLWWLYVSTWFTYAQRNLNWLFIHINIFRRLHKLPNAFCMWKKIISENETTTIETLFIFLRCFVFFSILFVTCRFQWFDSWFYSDGDVQFARCCWNWNLWYCEV